MTFTANAEEVLEALKTKGRVPEYHHVDDPSGYNGKRYVKTGEWTTDENLTEDWNDLGGRRVIIDGEEYGIEEVDSTGGMDEGSNASVTLKIGDRYFQKQGYYASHYGYDWDGAFLEVYPSEKKIIVYGPYSEVE